MYEFTVPGRPVGKGRPRVTRRGITYTPKKTRDYEALVKGYARAASVEPLEGPVSITVHFTLLMAKSWPKVKRRAFAGKYVSQHPDLDNMLKAIMDALDGIAYNKDSQVASIHASKMWTDNPKLEGANVYIDAL